jgi:hypothetical protein
VLRIDESVQHLISRDQPKDPDLIPLEPLPRNPNILEEVIAPTIDSPITTTTSEQPLSNNQPITHDTLLPSEDNKFDTSPNNTILTTVVERLEPDGSIPVPAQQAMIKELRNIINYDVWEPVDKNTRITKAIKSLMIAVEKFTAEGIFDKWKGRLAGMGNMLKRKIKTDTTSPTIDMASLFLLINIANH